MPLKDIIEHIRTEWRILKSVPFTFIILFVLAFLLSYWIFKDRMEAKDDRISELEHRLHMTEFTGTTFQLLTNKELKDKSVSLVNRIRGFLVHFAARSDSVHNEYWYRVNRAKSEEERNDLFDANVSASRQLGLEQSSQYNSKFKTETILLYDELTSRLPKNVLDTLPLMRSSFENPINPITIQRVVTELERLASLLPEK